MSFILFQMFHWPIFPPRCTGRKIRLANGARCLDFRWRSDEASVWLSRKFANVLTSTSTLLVIEQHPSLWSWGEQCESRVFWRPHVMIYITFTNDTGCIHGSSHQAHHHQLSRLNVMISRRALINSSSLKRDNSPNCKIDAGPRVVQVAKQAAH